MTFKQTGWVYWQLLLPDHYEINEDFIVLKIRKWFKPMNQNATISYENIASVEANKAGRLGVRGWLLNYGHIVIRTNSKSYELKCVKNHKAAVELIQVNIRRIKELQNAKFKSNSQGENYTF